MYACTQDINFHNMLSLKYDIYFYILYCKKKIVR